MRSFLGVGFCVLGTLVAIACVGEDPDSAPVGNDAGGGNEGGTGSETGTNEDGGGGTDSGNDAAPPRVIAIATGASYEGGGTDNFGGHTCAIVAPEGKVFCWGANDRGQLGDGDTGNGVYSKDRTTAHAIATDDQNTPFSGIEEIAVGGWHSCARKGATVYCWGERQSGAVGDGTVKTGGVTPLDAVKPKTVGLVTAKRIGTGAHHTCAVLTSGRGMCWGYQSEHQLGHRVASPPDTFSCNPFFDPGALNACNGTPIEVRGEVSTTTDDLTNAKDVIGGDFHSCALLEDNSVKCWGRGYDGQLGTGSLDPSTFATPVPYIVALSGGTGAKLEGVVGLGHSVNGKHSCAFTLDGKVHCWGLDNTGQLGDGTVGGPLQNSARATLPLPGGKKAIGLGVSANDTCAVLDDHTLACWGWNKYSQLTRAPADGESLATPTLIHAAANKPLIDVAAVAVGYEHVCALKTDGTVWCWGKNDRGQLGDGTNTTSQYPVQVKGLP